MFVLAGYSMMIHDRGFLWKLAAKRTGAIRCFAFAILLLVFPASACSQSSLREITDENEISVGFDQVYKSGPIKKYSVSLKDVPDSIPVPNGYQVLENKSYVVRTQAVVSGDTVVSFRVLVKSEEEFKNVRVLRLITNEMNPSGFEWADCTIRPDAPPDGNKKRNAPKYDERLIKFFPNYSQKRVSCVSDDIKSDNYFVVTRLNQPEPKETFTQIKVELEDVTNSPNSGEMVYLISFRNMGDKDLAEVNFISVFDVDSKLSSIKPSQGKCKASPWAASDGSATCYLGPISAGASASVEFRGAPSGTTGKYGPQKPNEGWSIDGVMKEHPNDPNWQVNWFRFAPIPH